MQWSSQRKSSCLEMIAPPARAERKPIQCDLCKQAYQFIRDYGCEGAAADGLTCPFCGKREKCGNILKNNKEEI